MSKEKGKKPEQDIPSILSRVHRPKKAIVTSGMPYANGPIHIGHMAGAYVPSDIYARWMRMLIGKENVLYVCGSDDHGSNADVTAKSLGKTTSEFISEVRELHNQTWEKYGISFNTYTGTSQPENMEFHKEYCQDFLRTLYKNEMLTKKTTEQWYDPKMEMFLPDRFVHGTCPNENCGNTKAYSDECDDCGSVYEPRQLKDPKSAVSDATPVLKETDHWWLDMWKVSDQLKEWIDGKKKTWRKNVTNEVATTVCPSFAFSNKHEPDFKEFKESLPKHKSRYAPGKKIVAQFESLADLEVAKKVFEEKSIEVELVDGWAHRSITRDVAWGLPVPEDVDPAMKGKTFYVWPESLVAPISFTNVALKQAGRDPQEWKDFWTDPESKVYQFLGIDNVYFYVLMQGAMWFGTQEDPFRQPKKGELQLTDIFSNFHLQIEGEKMSKSKGNFYTANQLIDEMGYHPDQVRYFVSILSVTEKPSNFDFENFKRRNEFLAGPLNAAFEKPISACHSKFDGKIPSGDLIGKTEKETKKIVQNYVRMMERGEYAKILFAVENYARIINGLFTQFKPHDDRFDEKQRKDALYSSFYILKNVMIMLHPFAPATMEKLRSSLNLPESIYSVDELGKDLPGDHKIGEQTEYFPAVATE